MKKFSKKLLSVLLASAMVSVGAVMPIFAAESETSYADGTLTVNADKSYNSAKVFVVSYNGDGTLNSVKTQDVSLVQGENKITVTAGEGDRILIWDMSEGKMDAVCDGLTVEAEAIPENAILFDFGEADTAAEGYYSVTPDTVYSTNKSGDLQYGLHGTDGYGYKISRRVDGIEMQEGQNIVLQTGAKSAASSADDDWIGVTDGQYPIRFAMNTANNTYYEVTAVLTGADQTKSANVSLYSEKRHPIIEQETINPGETKTVKFTATVQNVYYQKSDPVGTYTDDQLNVVVLGDNAAISSLMVVPVEHKPTVWIYTDSTGCDYQAPLPYFGLQNFGGVGQWLTKYLPEGIAISNQGEGGLNAADNMHWNCAKANIQAGDYVYVEYGHNHKDDGTAGYLSAIPKYYNYAHSVGAYTIYVGPIDRHNSSQYDASTNTWSSTLKGFSDTAQSYVEELIANGADDVAFIDLNRPSLDWYEEVCEEVKAIRGADVYERNATDYYFQGVKGSSIDGTHPNDAGADNCASLFFEEAREAVAAGETEDATDSQKIQANVLKPLVTGNRDALPYTVTEEIVKAGNAPNSAYPDVYQPPNLPQYPTVIKNITITDGSVSAATVLTQNAKLTMDAYGIVVITVTDENGNEKGKIYSVEQVDNSVIGGTQELTQFTSDINIADTDTISAVVMKAIDGGEGLIVDPENVAYSAVYTPSEVEAELLTDEDGNAGEDFVFYGVSAGDGVSGHNDWNVDGSAVKTTTIGTDEEAGFNYVNAISTGAKENGNHDGSFYIYKSLDSEIGTTGKYAIDMDVRYTNVENYSTYYFNVDLCDGIRSGLLWGTQELTAYTIRNGGELYVEDTNVGALNAGVWTNVRYVIDMDLGTASVSVSGGDPVTVDIDNYKVISGSITPTKLTQISLNTNKAAADLAFANIHVQKLAASKLGDKTLKVSSANETMGTVSISGIDGNEYTATMNTMVAINAVANEGYEFVEWQNADGTNFSYEVSPSVRMHENLDIIAVFDVAETDPITYMFKDDFSKLTTDTLSANGWNSPNAQGSMTVETDSTEGIGNYLRYGANDNSRGATKSFGTTYTDTSGLVFSANLKFNNANTDPNEFTVHSGNITYNSGNLNYGCIGGYVLHIEQNSSKAVTINGAEASTFPNDTWVSVIAKCNFTDHTVDVTVTSLDGATTYYSGTVGMADTAANGISGLYFKFGRQAYGAVSFDNIKIYAVSELGKVTE